MVVVTHEMAFCPPGRRPRDDDGPRREIVELAEPRADFWRSEFPANRGIPAPCRGTDQFKRGQFGQERAND